MAPQRANQYRWPVEIASANQARLLAPVLTGIGAEGALSAANAPRHPWPSPNCPASRSSPYIMAHEYSEAALKRALCTRRWDVAHYARRSPGGPAATRTLEKPRTVDW